METTHALWTFPAIILAAMLIAWAAECGQFYISQGLALAVLAWVQTLPEFAVEAVIAWEAAHDPSKMHLVTANFTGSLRLFVGLGWPMVYFVAFFLGRKRQLGRKGPWAIEMEDEHALAVLSLIPALVYFLVIYFKSTLNLLDGVILIGIYGGYMWLISKMPPQDHEQIEDLGQVPKFIMRLPKPRNYAGILLLFFVGGLILWFGAHPFLDSMLALAVALGVSEFVFVQWMAPFLSEFPEKLSAFHWAKAGKAPMALANFVSSSINQWTVLVGMIPFVFSIALGRAAPIIFDEHQRVEILLTIVQSYLGFLFLVSMDFGFYEAVGLFGLWLFQFLVPGIREEITWIYSAWAFVETAQLARRVRSGERNAFTIFGRLARTHLVKS